MLIDTNGTHAHKKNAANGKSKREGSSGYLLENGGLKLFSNTNQVSEWDNVVNWVKVRYGGNDVLDGTWDSALHSKYLGSHFTQVRNT
ncbi:hypothetical protein TRICI_005044 [Trichomonascus ciferrii]|uniref:Uncharacterized protein n=1 Tax=Trichomonascus ciferrii TaxID=44093 RepID=A0A642UWK2_9ASCO|nr:hypothetical protein TRICI_005044 [Trichomonascus ciferrii]